MFTGDILEEAASDLAAFYQRELKSDILHVSHHGAKGGTPLNFLTFVNPQEAIISWQKQLYNHPHFETINNLRSKNVRIYQTR